MLGKHKPERYLGQPNRYGHTEPEIKGMILRSFRTYTISALVGYLILIGGGIWGISETNSAANHARKQQMITCNVQNRGLKASRRLIGTMRAIRALLSPLPGEKHIKQPPAVEKAIATLNAELDGYLRIQEKQPKHRVC